MPTRDDERRRLLWKLAHQFAGFSPDGALRPDEHATTEIGTERERVEEFARKYRLGGYSPDEQVPPADVTSTHAEPEHSSEQRQGDAELVVDAEDLSIVSDILLGALGYLDILEARSWAEYWAREVPPGSQYEVFGNALNFVADRPQGRGRQSARPEATLARAYVDAVGAGSGGSLRTPWLDDLIGLQRVVELPACPTAGQACLALTEFFEFPSYEACRQALIRVRTKVIEEWERIESLKQEDRERGWFEWRGSWRARLINSPGDFPVPPAVEPEP